MPPRDNTRITFVNARDSRILSFAEHRTLEAEISEITDTLMDSFHPGCQPSPYLSDLGVSPPHRRRGIGEQLVAACERWTCARGYEKLYLKVEKKNVAAVGFYSSLGYDRTKLPWGDESGHAVEGYRWDTTLLLEKSLTLRGVGGTKRTWMKDQLWRPIKERVDRISTKSNTAPPI
ncbi:hypothetical protein ACHAW5_002218 [Stephanodiscus triporus]|uniref:N-acetyltransferase domain-containing protein n=1 Tax=Stephanodiscus triporus TaxID=2934178 RepID=A0ABD3PHW4_9STRA